MTPPWVAVAELAARQHGVVSLLQLRRLGFTDRETQYRVRVGHLHRIHRGVYAVGHERLTENGHYMAAVLACGEHTALSHRSAAALLGLRPCTRTVVEVSVSGRQARSRRGIQAHAGTLLTRDVALIDGIPCTTPARTLLDLAEVVDSQTLAKALERTQILRTFDLRQFEDVLGRAQGRRGAPTLASLIADLTEPRPTRSELERAFLAACERASVPPPLVNSLVEVGGVAYEVDFLWPEHRLAVETDGFETHGTRAQFERDRLRDQRLLLAGYRVLRFTWRQVMHEGQVVTATVGGVLAERERTLRA